MIREHGRESHQGSASGRGRTAAAALNRDREGEERTSIELQVDEIGVSLCYSPVKVTKTDRTSVSQPSDTEEVPF